MARSTVKLNISSAFDGSGFSAAARAMGKFERNAEKLGGGSGSATGLAELSIKADQFARKMEDVGSSMQTAGSTATAALTVPIVGAAAICIAKASEMESAFANVRKTVDATAEEYEGLYNAAIEMSKVHPIEASEVANIQSLGAQLGIAKENLAGFAEVVYGLDIATNLSAEEGATQLAQFANICGTSQIELSNVGSTLVALGNTSATTEADIMNLGMRFAAAGTQAGMSAADVLAVSASLASLGLEAEAGGTAISMTIAGIDKDVATNGANMETWAQLAGMSVEEFAAAWKRGGDSTTDAFIKVIEGMAATEDAGGNLTVMLEELGIDGIRQSDAMKRLAGNTGLLSKSVETANQAYAENSALTNEVANFEDTFASKLQVTKNKLTAVAIEAGGPLLDAFGSVIDSAEPLIDGIADAAKVFSEMDEGQQRLVIGLAATAAAIGPVATVGGKLVSMFSAIPRGIGKAAAKFAELAVEAKAAAINSGKLKNGAELTNKQLGLMTVKAGAAKSAMGLLKGGAALLAVEIGAKAVSAFAGFMSRLTLTTLAANNLRDSMRLMEDAVSVSAANVAGAVDDMGVDVDEALKNQIELADKMRETWTDVAADSAMVESYTDTIMRLEGQSNLTAEQQAELAQAVEGYNSLCGTSIEVVDGQNGKLSENRDAILAVKDAYIEQAEAMAVNELLSDAVKQREENSRALAQAEADLAEIEAEVERRNGDVAMAIDGTLQKHAEARQKVDAARQAYEASSDAVDYYTERNKELADAYLTDATAISQMLGAVEGMPAVLEGTGFSLDQFSQSLSDLGVSTVDLQTLTADQLTQLAGSYDGTASSIVAALEQFGIDLGAKGTAAGDNFATGLAGTEAAAEAAAAGVSSVAASAMSSADTGAEGTKQGIDYASNISACSSNARIAGSWLSSSALEGMNVDTTGAGYDAADGFSRGILGFDIGSTMRIFGTSALSSLKAALGIHSPSREMMALAGYAAEGWRIGFDPSIAAEASERFGTAAADALAAVPIASAEAAPRSRSVAASAPAERASARVEYSMDAMVEILERIESLLSDLASQGFAVNLSSRELGRAVRSYA